MTSFYEIEVPAIYETTTVNKIQFKFWRASGWNRGTWAQNVETEEIKKIESEYLRNDLTVRKAIARKFGLPTFRK